MTRNVKINIQEVRLESVDWIHLAQDRQGKWWALLNTVLIVSGCIKCWELLDWLLKDDYNA